MSLSDRQWEFLQALRKLLYWAELQPNYKVTLSCGRCQLTRGSAPKGTCGGHAAKSFHKRGLAVDLNLFIDGKYQTSTEAHERMGKVWKRFGGTWGGDFSRPDGNHYSWGESR